MISTTFDHVVVTVFDLEQAIADFSDEGFEELKQALLEAVLKVRAIEDAQEDESID